MGWVCSKCGKSNMDAMEFCLHCDAKRSGKAPKTKLKAIEPVEVKDVVSEPQELPLEEVKESIEESAVEEDQPEEQLSEEVEEPVEEESVETEAVEEEQPEELLSEEVEEPIEEESVETEKDSVGLDVESSKAVRSIQFFEKYKMLLLGLLFVLFVVLIAGRLYFKYANDKMANAPVTEMMDKEEVVKEPVEKIKIPQKDIETIEREAYSQMLIDFAVLKKQKSLLYYTKLGIITKDDKLEIYKFVNDNQEYTELGYRKLKAYHDKLSGSDVYLYHMAKLKREQEKYKEALEYLNMIENGFPNSKLKSKVEAMLSDIIGGGND